MPKVMQKIVLDGEEVNVPSGVGGTSEEVYSTEETRIGTWIDGKPLYRIVMHATSPSTIGNATNIVNIFNIIPNILDIVSVDGYLDSGTLGRVPLNYYFKDTIYVGTRWDKNIVMFCSYNNFTSKPVLLIVEYTKTTD